MKQLPLNIQSFPTLIENNCVYVDKTDQIYAMMQRISPLFISRPRRFGKSLLISTLKAIYEGRRELFEGLAISKTDYTWPVHPVVHLDFTIITRLTPTLLHQGLHERLGEIANQYDVQIPGQEQTLSQRFSVLIQLLSKKNKVVVLIDEYDKPILDHLKDLEVAAAQRAVIKDFYDGLKGVTDYIHRIFITGVTKFAKTSLFSGLNNLMDLTMMPEAATLLGYTQQELETYFAPHIAASAKKRNCSTQKILDDLKRWYDGYHFSEDLTLNMYNPISVLYFLETGRFKNYWSETGTPSFLIQMLPKQLGDLENMGVGLGETSLSMFDIDNIPLVPLLFQAGYLTLVGYDPDTGKYFLDHPNHEIRDSFRNYVLEGLTNTTRASAESLLAVLMQALEAADIDRIIRTLTIFFANIPHNLHIAKESYYHSLFHAMFDLMGTVNIQSEVSSSVGKLDLVMQTNKYLYVVEFKFKHTAQEAMDQILQRRYYEKYLGSNKRIILLGIAFTYEEKRLVLDYVTQDVPV